MILVPKERTWSKLYDDDKNFYNFFVLLPKMKERKSVLELRANTVVLIFWRELYWEAKKNLEILHIG